jgi:DNA-binding MarR family transcriptional regulator
MKLDDSYLFTLNRLNRKMMRKTDQFLVKEGVSTIQLFILMALSEKPGCLISELVSILDSDMSGIGRTLGRMNKKGLIDCIKRSKSGIGKGRFAFIYFLSKGGEEFLKKLDTRFEELDLKMREGKTND